LQAKQSALPGRLLKNMHLLVTPDARLFDQRIPPQRGAHGREPRNRVFTGRSHPDRRRHCDTETETGRELFLQAIVAHIF